MAAPAPGPPTIRDAPPPLFVEHLFFKSFPVLTLPSPGPRRDLLDRSSHSLSCSSKYGVLLVAGQERLTIIPAKELLQVQTQAGNSHQKRVELGQVPYATVDHPSFGTSPTIVAISIGEEYVALDTLRQGVSFVLIFKFGEFLTPGSGCQPFVELRASLKEGSKVSAISWNPGENMSNMLAINCDDGSLQLVSIKGANAVEMCSYKESNVRSMCWSPKGKQLVIGKSDGSLCQLKLDLNEAKKIPPPAPGQTPSALFWTSTTQFLVNYVVEDRDIDLTQLDLVKGAPLNFTKFGDVYVSDRVDSQAKCSFVPILPWNVIICASNTINDLVVIGKGLHEAGENWIVADLNDNRRAAIPIDSFPIGAALFTGFESPVTFNETESYQSMPVLFVLSESGALASFVLVNTKGDAPSLFQKVSNALPPQLFLSSGEEVSKGASKSGPAAAHFSVGGGDGPPTTAQGLQSQPFKMLQLPGTATPTLEFGNLGLSASNKPNVNLFGSQNASQEPSSTTSFTGFSKPESGLNFSLPLNSGGASNNFPFGMGLNFNTATSTTSSMTPTLTHPQSTTPSIIQPVVSAKSAPAPPPAVATSNKQQPLFDMKSLPTSGLPSLQQVEDLKRIVEEKRAQGSFCEVDDSDEPDMDELLLEVEKFRKRLELHNQRKAGASQKIDQTFTELRKVHEVDVLTPLNLMEDFVSTVKETKEIQSEEVNGIKERVFSHYTELEYAKALGERNKDPKYIQLLMAQQMDTGRAKKFCETEKLYQYIKNQTVECERFYKFQNQQSNTTQNSSVLQEIYQTLANHSKVIRKLAHNVNVLRSQMGLGKTLGMEDIRVFEIPTMGHNYYEKKPLLKERPTITIQKSNVHKVKAEKEDNRITLDDLTAGMSRVQLNKLKEAGGRSAFTNHKPMRISTKKLDALTKIVSKVEEIEIPEVDNNYYDLFDISVKNRARSRNLIQKLDDKTVPLPIKTEDNIPEDWEEVDKSKTAAGATAVVPNPTPQLAPQPLGKSATAIFSIPVVPSVPAKTSPTAASAASISTIGSITSSLMAPPSAAVSFGTTPSSASLFRSPSPKPITTSSTNSAPFSFESVPPSSSLFGVPPSKPAFASVPVIFGTTQNASTISSTPSIMTPTLITKSPAPTPAVAVAVTPSIGSIPSAAVVPGRNQNLINKLEDKTTPPSKNIPQEINKTILAPTSSSVPPALSTSGTILSTTSIFQTPPTLSTPPIVAPVTTSPAAASVLGSRMPSTTSTVVAATSSATAAPLTFGSIASSPSIFGTASPKPGLGNPPALSVIGGGATHTVAAIPATTFAASPAFGSGGSSFGSIFGSSSIPAASEGSIFASPTTTTSSSLFRAPPATTITTSSSLFGGPPATTITTSSSLFGAAPTSTTTTTSPSLFGAAPTSTTTTTSSSLFGAPPSSTSTTSSSLFGAPPSSTTTTTSSSLFGAPPSTTSTTSSSLFGAAPTSTPGFGTPTSTVFGVTTAFGSSAFGVSTTSGVGGGGGDSSGSIFAPTTSSSLFGAASPKPTFGTPTSSVFGGAAAFGSPASATFGGSPTFGSGGTGSTFGSAFGSTTNPAGGGAGDGTSIFGANAASPSIFGSPAAKPGFGSAPVFGSSPAFGSPATFGGSPAFGSGGSTFGSAFGSTSPSGGAAAGEGSIFGGGSIQQSAPSFGALAQAAPPPAQQGFGSFAASPAGGGGSLFGGEGASLFGGAGQQQSFGGGQASSPFSQQQQQQPSAFGGGSGNATSASFGGSAFSSWR